RWGAFGQDVLTVKYRKAAEKSMYLRPLRRRPAAFFGTTTDDAGSLRTLSSIRALPGAFAGLS
ncbi:MAG: hypothetical protein IIZ55_02150, partial [Firmicutes bacterium]|nr:hypothetical protein [Bacillota bacterium]